MRSKKRTRPCSCTYTECFKSVLKDLFHPRSKKALIRYKSLKLINLKQLNLIDIPVLSAFLKVAISLSLTIFIMLGLASSYFAYMMVQTSTYEISLASKKDVSYIVKTRYSTSNVGDVDQYKELTGNMPNGGLVAGISDSNVELYYEASPNNIVPAVSLISTNSTEPVCSFHIFDSYYSDGSRIDLSMQNNPIYVCASLSKASSSTDNWTRSHSGVEVNMGAGMKMNSNTNCINADSVSDGDILILSVQTAGKTMASCSVSFTKSSSNNL